MAEIIPLVYILRLSVEKSLTLSEYTLDRFSERSEIAFVLLKTTNSVVITVMYNTSVSSNGNISG